MGRVPRPSRSHPFLPMFAQWLTTAATVAAFGACLYMWSNAEALPERWHRLFRLGSWGALIGAPAAAGLQLAAGMRWSQGWSGLDALANPTHRLSIYAGALLGSAVACRFARLQWREALEMAVACVTPYAVGLFIAGGLAGRTYSFFMLDAWQAPEAYLAQVQAHLAVGYWVLTILGGSLASFMFAGRVWRLWGAALPEDLGLAAWPPLELDLDLEPDPDEREARA